MSGEIKIEVETLKDAVSRLNSAIDIFEGYVNNYVSEARNSLDCMHSNFIQDLMKTLNNMRDNSNPKTLNEVKSFSENVAAAIEAYVETDDTIAGQISAC